MRKALFLFFLHNIMGRDARDTLFLAGKPLFFDRVIENYVSCHQNLKDRKSVV